MLAVLGLGRNGDTGTARAPYTELANELVGKCLGDKGRLVNALNRRLKLNRCLEIGRDVTRRRLAVIDAAAPQVGSFTNPTEAAEDIGGIERRKGPHRVQPQPLQDIDEIGQIVLGSGRKLFDA